MLIKNTVGLYMTAFVNLLFLTIIGILSNFFLFSKQFYVHGIKAIIYQYLFLNTLIYVFYALIFVLIFDEYRIKIIIKAFVMGLVSVFIVVFLSYAASGLIPLRNLEYSAGLLIMFGIGFLLPYSQKTILNCILFFIKRMKNV